MVVLGISASSRVAGIAVLQNSILLDFSVRLFKESWSDTKAERIVASLTSYGTDHCITNVALTIPHVYYQHKETEVLIAQIRSHYRKKKINVSTYHPEAFHALCPEAKATKKALMRFMAEQYPELAFPYRKELRNKRRYYHKLFEAVGAATLLSQALEHTSQK